MTKKKARWCCRLLAFCLSVMLLPAGQSAAYASDSKKTISKVNITLDLELTPDEKLPSLNAGDKNSGGNVEAGSERYTATEAKWISSGSKKAEIGKTYTLKVDIESKDPDQYIFKGTYSDSNISVKGGTFVSASKKNSRTLAVTVRTKPVKGQYEAPEEAEWKDTPLGRAEWDKVDGVEAYDVTLYRGGSSVYKIKAYKGTKVNLYPYMTKAGTYTFKVRAVAKDADDKDYAESSEWTESDELYIGKDYVSDGTGKVDYNSSGTGSSINHSTQAVGWIQDGSRWWYRYPDGSYQKDSWLLLNNAWYLFDKDGWMLTGWQQKDGNWYFLDPNGAMVTGWLPASEGWYFLNPGPDGPLGAMYHDQWLFSADGKIYYFGSNGLRCEGWKQVGNDWYYFYPGDGGMAVNTIIETFYIGPDGIWRK